MQLLCMYVKASGYLNPMNSSFYGKAAFNKKGSIPDMSTSEACHIIPMYYLYKVWEYQESVVDDDMIVKA